jgi:hypothetical protein
MWVAAGDGVPNKLAYSYNGINWTGLNVIFSSNGYGIAWNGSMWVAGGTGTANTLAYSYDGINWTGLGKTVFSTAGNGVAWNGSMWVATGSGTANTLAYSYDGINWTGLGKSVHPASASAIAWNGKRSQSISLDVNGSTNTNALQISTSSYANGNIAVNITSRP